MPSEARGCHAHGWPGQSRLDRYEIVDLKPSSDRHAFKVTVELDYSIQPDNPLDAPNPWVQKHETLQLICSKDEFDDWTVHVTER